MATLPQIKGSHSSLLAAEMNSILRSYCTNEDGSLHEHLAKPESIFGPTNMRNKHL